MASQVGYLPFDFKRHDWAGPLDWKWRALPIKRGQLPDLVPAGSPLGVISAQAAKVTGIPEGLPLISAGADKACEVLASGCLTPDTGSLSYGTTATYNSTNTRYIEAIKHVPAYPAAMPNAYNTETIVQRGYWMVNWFKREFGLREQRIAAERGVEAETLFDDLLREVPPGAMGLDGTTVLVSRRSHTRARGQGRHDRVWGCAYTRSHLSRHYRRTGLCPARR